MNGREHRRRARDGAAAVEQSRHRMREERSACRWTGDDFCLIEDRRRQHVDQLLRERQMVDG